MLGCKLLRLHKQDEEIARKKDEISTLKREKKRPKFKGSALDSRTDSKADADASDTSKKRAGSRKKAKNSQLTIHEEKILITLRTRN